MPQRGIRDGVQRIGERAELARHLEESLLRLEAGADSVADEGRPSEEIQYHIRLLAEAGLIEADEIVPGQWWPERITWMGHELLDALEPVQASKSWLADILGDGDALELSRIQYALWLPLIGLAFAYHVVQHIALPEWQAPMLALVGISASTYVGYRVAT